VFFVSANGGIYKILNSVTGRYYIGSAVNFNTRKSHHFGKLRRNVHDNNYLQRAFNKYGEDSFSFIVMEYVADKSKLIEREQYYLDNLKPCERDIGYNICPTAGNLLGYKPSKQTKEKISAGLIGNVPWNKGKKGIYSDDTLEKMAQARRGKTSWMKGKTGILSGDKNPMWGKKHSEATRTKIGEALKDGGFIAAHGASHYKSRRIRQLKLDGCVVKEYDTMTLAATGTGITRQLIGYCCQGKQQSTGGYKWEYAS
jgi:group I intron endonuclease